MPREFRVHFDPAHTTGGVLCKEPRWISSDTDAERVTCLRCLFFLGRYFPTADKDPERRAELLERLAKMNG